MDITKLKPVPKSVIEKMKKADKKYYIFPNNNTRFYSYLTTIDRELVKVTVAVRTLRDVFYFKQVAVHGIRSKKCFVRDMEYIYYTGMGYQAVWDIRSVGTTTSFPNTVNPSKTVSGAKPKGATITPILFS